MYFFRLLYPLIKALGIEMEDYDYKHILLVASLPFWLPVVYAWDFVIKGEFPEL